MTNHGNESDPVHSSGSEDEQLVDDSNSTTTNSVFVDVEHSISRSSLRSNNKRIENLSTNKLLPRTGDRDFTDFISIMFIAEKEQWKGNFQVEQQKKSQISLYDVLSQNYLLPNAKIIQVLILR